MRNKKYLPLLTTVLLFAGCSKEAPFETSPEPEPPAGQMVLGKKLENPYSVANMRKAYAALSPQTRAGSDLAEEQIVATHLYVKFMPETEEQENILMLDKELILYQYPLDYDIITYGQYVDPSIPEGQPLHFYASVEVGKELPKGVKYEILEYLYIPDEYDQNEEPAINTRASYSLDESFIEALVDKSLDLTGNSEPEVGLTRGSNKWRPAGYITYFDDVLGQSIGMEGIEVKARRWFTTHKGIVNSSGYYSCDGTFKLRANYEFDFTRHDFAVMSDDRTYPYVNGPKQYGNWNYNFNRSSSESYYYWATIFRAAHLYCYGNIDGLGRPPQAGVLKSKIRIHAEEKDDMTHPGVFRGTYHVGWFKTKKIHMRCLSSPTDRIYAYTLHELAHSAHWNYDQTFSASTSDIVKESWSTAAEVYFARKLYSSYVPSVDRGCYTNIGVDLMDAAGLRKSCDYSRANNDTEEVYSPLSYIDNVEGYTIHQIQDAIFGSSTWSNFQTNLSRYENATKDHLSEAFTFWSTL